MKKTWAALAMMSALIPALCPAGAGAAPVDDAVQELQRSWEIIRYQTPAAQRAQRFEALAAQAHATSAQFAGRSEPLIWEGIVLSSWAGEKGGLGALGLVKQAKALYERAIEADGRALSGSAYASLGVLYAKVPGWPLGFGDAAKAEALFKQALALNPQGIDPHFFYAEFLADQGRTAEARAHLDSALQAPPRPGREGADSGRRDEVKALQARLKAS
jgi:tetratricopeptide (TPR) repeat protein